MSATATRELFSFADPPATAARPRSVPYHRGLDGLRAVAVLAVLAYHQSSVRLPGGFLGVDVFFTLSGFLITSLLLAEHTRTGRLDIRRFWVHRIRRLVPALLLTILLVSAWASWLAADGSLAQLRGDAAASMAYVLNWRFVLEGRSYFFEFFPSPLRHLWSLGVEMQWYLIWPVVVWLVLRGTDRRSAVGPLRVLLVAVALAGLSALEMAWLFDPGTDPSRAYYGTDAHASPLLIGAAVAALGAWRPWPRDRATTLCIGALGIGGAMALAWAFFEATGTSPWLYEGGFALVGIAAAAVVVAAGHDAGPGWANPVRLGLSVLPLVWLGRISYGVYLYHWPLYFVVTTERTGLVGWQLFLARLAATVALATASYLAIERPIRRGALTRLRVSPLVLPGAVALVAVTLLSATAGSSAPWLSRDDLDVADRPAPSVPTTAPGAPLTDQETRVLVVGDSVAYTLAIGFEDGVADDEDLVVWNQAVLYCELVQRPRREGGAGGEEREPADACESWPELWSDAVTEFDPHVVVVEVGPWEVFDRRTSAGWARFGTEAHDALLQPALDRLVDVAGAEGATVVLLLAPPLDRTDGVSAREWTFEEAWRIEHLNALLEDAAVDGRARGHTVELVDLAPQVCPGGDEEGCPDEVDGVDVRGDGIHFTESGGEAAAAWLAPQLRGLGLDAARRRAGAQG